MICSIWNELVGDNASKLASAEAGAALRHSCDAQLLHNLQVVRQAVQDGTLGQLLANHAATKPPPRPSRARKQGARPANGGAAPAASAGGGAAEPLIAGGGKVLPLDTIWCALCTNPKREGEIAITVGNEAFCEVCDHIRRRANNLGLATREVTSAYRCGSLAGFLGLSQGVLDTQISHPNAANGAAPVGTKRAATLAAAPGGGGKAGTLGRMCRMCRQVRAPIVGAPPPVASVLDRAP
jgi:hypothetical protein